MALVFGSDRLQRIADALNISVAELSKSVRLEPTEHFSIDGASDQLVAWADEAKDPDIAARLRQIAQLLKMT